jgi:hypothetical protein
MEQTLLVKNNATRTVIKTAVKFPNIIPTLSLNSLKLDAQEICIVIEFAET